MCLETASSTPEQSGLLTQGINPLFLEAFLLITLPTLLTFLLWLVAGLTSLFTLLGFLSHLDWKLELFSHFRVQYALLLGVCGLNFIVWRNQAGMLLSLGFLGINMALILPIYFRPTHRERSGKSYRLFFANILGPNTRYDRIQAAIIHADADIVLLVEVRPNHLENLLPSLSNYPHQFTLPDTKNYGVAIFSRLPLESQQALVFTEDCTPEIFTRLKLDGILLTLLGIHVFPPKSRSQAARRNHQLALTASFAAAQAGELLLVGDLNATAWSHAFKELRRRSHLLDSRQGIGLQPSWPAGNILLRIPIDHALHTPGIAIHARGLGLATGSDHLPLIIDFSPTSANSG
jgi:endonuclease/exonuclease/phosphatase (EEP) superfamily protein YafD